MQEDEGKMGQKLRTDWILFITVVAMVSMGLLIVYSASSVMAELKYGSIWYFVKRQAAWAAVAILAMMTLKKTDYRKFQSPTVAFTAMGLALALLIFVYWFDATHHRWLRFGPLSLQPSELAKPALVVFLAFFVTWRRPAINTKYTLVPAALAVGLVIFWVVVADLGTAVVLGATAAVVFFVAGLKARYCAISAAVAMAGVVFFIAAAPYRAARVVRFFDPQLKLVDRIDPGGRVRAYLTKSIATRDTNYQLTQSKIAVGTGGPAGVGLMEGKQKLLYLPEGHTDFIFAVAAEEMGFLGATALLSGFLILFWRGLRAAWCVQDDFGRYLALGVTAIVVVQAMINISVVLGLMPTKGIPLPLISSGGSSLLSTLASIGILMNVSEHVSE
jgi:cell division protein FtsW